MGELDLTDGVVKPFLGYLAESAVFRQLTSATNSFEGWLKWELAAFVARRHEWLGDAGVLNGDKVGVEWRVPLASVGENDRAEKLVDFWCAAGPDQAGYHAIEIKVVFGNGNWGKQARSAGHDLWYLGAIAPEERMRRIGSLVFFLSGRGNESVSVSGICERVEEACLPVKASRPDLTVDDALPEGVSALFFVTDWEQAHAQLLER